LHEKVLGQEHTICYQKLCKHQVPLYWFASQLLSYFHTFETFASIAITDQAFLGTAFAVFVYLSASANQFSCFPRPASKLIANDNCEFLYNYEFNSFHSTVTQCHSCSSILLAVSCLFKIVLTSHIFLELFLYLCFLFLFIVNFCLLPFTLLFENNFVRCVCEIIQPPFIFLTANHDHFQPFQDISNHHAYFRAVSTTYHNSFYSLLNLKATLPIFIFTFIFFHRKLFNIIENH
jgi:hypothetical protein